MTAAWRRRLFSYGVVVPFAIVLAFPFVWMAVTSFKNQAQVYAPTKVWTFPPTLANYGFLFHHTGYLRWLRNSTFVGVVVVLITLAVAVPAGYALARLSGRTGRALGVAIFLTYLVPPTLLFLPLSRVVAQYLHLSDRLWALVVVYPSFTIPFAIWLLMGFFKTIPQELEDAALVDGCSRLGSLVRIVFPISIPGILTVVIFTFSLVANEFVYAITFISSSTNRTLTVGVPTDLIRGDLFNWPGIMAAILIPSIRVALVNNTLLDTRAAAEVAAQSGHDLFFNLHPMASYEDQVINHAPIIKEIERKVGPYGPLAKSSTYNPKTKKYFAVSDNYVPDPVVWRHDIWNGIGEAPFTWDHVRKAAPKLKADGHPIGIGQSQELDSNMALLAFMMCFGSFVQSDLNRPTPNSKNTIDAVNLMAALYKNGEDAAIFGWNPASNNNYLYSGTASAILHAASATRTPEAQNLPFTKDLWIWPIPHGPHGRLGLEHVMGCYNIWKFSQNKQNAQQFLVDLCVNYKQATTQSQLYNFPSFPGAYPFPQIRKAAAP